ncbi:hypothetical protein BDF20DRAFT_834286 [Mycotypha africana]|uniref:uncharacterized protein n=1 Tax=Mycotypha africana TaxID=64632 RepID=UPI002300C6CB|nr:uncharacterized protein BDF20DRAFT_834286 [Mycotypha africana]KAI8981588.1 hypothetical protein BDF20DRAFT_834286 [Mycotypha africana]
MAPKSINTNDDREVKIKQILGNIGQNFAELAYLILQGMDVLSVNQANSSSPAGETVAKKKRKRFPDEPIPPRSSFFHYMEAARKKDKTDNKSNAIAQSKQFGEQWQNMSDKEKKHYIDIAAKDRERYDKEIEAYVKKHPEHAELVQDTRKHRSKQVRESTPSSPIKEDASPSKKARNEPSSPSKKKTKTLPEPKQKSALKMSPVKKEKEMKALTKKSKKTKQVTPDDTSSTSSDDDSEVGSDSDSVTNPSSDSDDPSDDSSGDSPDDSSDDSSDESSDESSD